MAKNIKYDDDFEFQFLLGRLKTHHKKKGGNLR